MSLSAGAAEAGAELEAKGGALWVLMQTSIGPFIATGAGFVQRSRAAIYPFSEDAT